MNAKNSQRTQWNSIFIPPAYLRLSKLYILQTILAAKYKNSCNLSIVHTGS
jgi:hypothetical protein